MTEMTDETIARIASDSMDTYDFARAIIAADRAQQSVRHAEELAAYEVTVSNLREQALPERQPMLDADYLGVRESAKHQWNAGADRYNSWDDLGQDEQDALIVRAVEAFHGIKEKP